MSPDKGSHPISALLQSFFCDRLLMQRSASPQTVGSYRDTFRLFVSYAATRTGRQPSALLLEDFDAPMVVEFLAHIEKVRGNSARTRNARLAAIRSFMSYASHQAPAALPVIQRVLAIPSKRYDRPILGFLSRAEIESIIDAPDRTTWSGRRDIVMFATFYNTGARVSEVIGLRVGGVRFGANPCLSIHGKGRKERVIPLWKTTARRIQSWVSDRNAHQDQPLFPNKSGHALSRSGVERRLRVAVEKASAHCPSLEGRRISPHTLRHTTAMHLLQSGVDITVIALWLGHESPTTTHGYMEADLSMKRRAIDRLSEPSCPDAAYRPSDKLLAFLNGL